MRQEYSQHIKMRESLSNFLTDVNEESKQRVQRNAFRRPSDPYEDRCEMLADMERVDRS